MRESRRLQRVEKELRQLIGEFLLTGIKDPLPPLVSVNRVAVSGDMRSAKVFLSMMDSSQDQRHEVLEMLQNHRGSIQHHIKQHLHMKFYPRLEFCHDTGMEKALKVEKILFELAQDKSVDDSSH